MRRRVGDGEMRATNTFRWVEKRDARCYQTRLELAKFMVFYLLIL